MLSSLCILPSAFSQTNSATMYNGGGNNAGTYGSYYGTNCDVTGVRSFGGGYNSDVSGSYSVGLGYNANVGGTYSFGFGRDTDVTGSYSIGLGYNSDATASFSTSIGTRTKATGSNTLAIGTDAKATVTKAFAIGVGYNTTYPLENNISNSLMVGFNSNLPTLFVGAGSGVGTYGKVGIATTTPSSSFEVADVNGSDIDTKLNGFTLINGAGSSLLFGNGSGAAYGEWGIEAHTDGLNFWKPYGATGGLKNYCLFIENLSGNVGVNTDNPTAPLTVNGKTLIGDPSLVSTPNGYKLFVQEGILTEKVKVALYNTTDWADYVFETDYELRSLTEVKRFVEVNKHLPGVPSAQELVDNEGYDLSKMDATLLEKIEELTLYTIELAEQNKNLQERIKQLEDEK
ncbi:MAG: hypothetical protein HWE22_01505 [Flavobacteriales bacterium]|nr:hypothetical protein [Flavobacteriales bacterium]